jgi:hypothetical protein
MRRPLFQFHLSTAVVLMFVAAARRLPLICVHLRNLRMKP